MSEERKILQLPADGTIPAEARKRLKEKRLELGLAMKSVGAVLNVNWATVRKWENGETAQCSISNRRRLEKFLNGEYDGLFGQPSPARELGEAAAPPPVPSALAQRLEALHKACRRHPELQTELLAGVQRVMDDILLRLAAE